VIVGFRVLFGGCGVGVGGWHFVQEAEKKRTQKCKETEKKI